MVVFGVCFFDLDSFLLQSSEQSVILFSFRFLSSEITVVVSFGAIFV